MSSIARASRLVGLGVTFAWLLSLAAGLAAAAQPAPDKARGTLTIEGKLIKRLTLVHSSGWRMWIADPGPSVLLPAGEYYVGQVDLEGGSVHAPDGTQPRERIVIAAHAPYRLRVGAPLRPSVQVTRVGTHLRLDYELVDAEGRDYATPNRSNPPRLAIYRGDREIHSGSFGYG